MDEKKILVTFIGTFGKWHGADILADSIVELKNNSQYSSIVNKLHFLFIGDGITQQLVKEIIKNGGVNSLCTFTGTINQSDGPIYLASSDILVAPHVPNQDGSRFFGSPTKLFEYMAMNKPIIASDLEQIGDVLNNSLSINNLPDIEPNQSNTELALLVEPGKYSDIAKAITFLASNPAWRNKIACNSRAEVLSKYTWEKHANKIIEAINKKS